MKKLIEEIEENIVNIKVKKEKKYLQEWIWEKGISYKEERFSTYIKKATLEEKRTLIALALNSSHKKEMEIIIIGILNHLQLTEQKQFDELFSKQEHLLSDKIIKEVEIIGQEKRNYKVIKNSMLTSLVLMIVAFLLTILAYNQEDLLLGIVIVPLILMAILLVFNGVMLMSVTDNLSKIE